MTTAAGRRAVVFDLDGTLVDSLPLVLAAIQHAIAPFGGRTTRDIFAHLGGPPERFLGSLVGDPVHVPEAMRRMNEFHDGNAHLIQPFDGAAALLGHLAEARVQVAVWTGRDRASTEPLLRAHGLTERFVAVVCGDDLPSHKPDPAGLREILQRVGTRAEDMIFVGDADVDVLGGHACGVDTILIRHDRTIAASIAARSWQVVDTPAAAYALVRGATRPAG